MVLCNNECQPCCDFCIYVHREYDGKASWPNGCLLHEDERHQELAENCSWCEDFHCFMATGGEKVETVTDKHVHISRNISKLGSAIPSVSLPAIATCRVDAPCKSSCYACKGRFSMLKVRNLLWKNLEVWEDNPAGFEEDVYVAAYQSRYFRWHSAGDIPDEAYLHMMVRLASRLPKTNFLCFTKRFEMINEYLSSAQRHSFPPNLQIVLSAWGDFIPDNPYNLPVAYVRFKKEQTQIPASAFQCKKFCGECVLTDQSCWNLKHGESVVFDEH